MCFGPEPSFFLPSGRIISSGPGLIFRSKTLNVCFRSLNVRFRSLNVRFRSLNGKLYGGWGKNTLPGRIFLPFFRKNIALPDFFFAVVFHSHRFGLPGGVHHHGHTVGTALPQVTYNIIMYRQTKLKTEMSMNRIINILSTCLVQAKAIGADAEGRQAYGSFAFLSAGSKWKGCPGLPQ